MTTPLTGPDLLSKVQELKASGASVSEICRVTGYVALAKDGSTRPKSGALHKALLDASGLALTSARTGSRRNGLLTINKSGGVVISKAHISKVGLGPGTTLRTENQGGNLVLIPVEIAETAPDAAPPLQQQGASVPGSSLVPDTAPAMAVA
jgi:hypothetical protein